MLADLDLLLTAVFCTADDLLPAKDGNARRSVTDAEIVTLAVAQEMMGVDHDAEFLAIAAKRLSHLFPKLAPAAWPLEAPAALLGHDRVADQRVRRGQPRLPRQRGAP